MILTLTLNTAIDQVIAIPQFELHKTIRANHAAIAMGAKPTDVSYILGTLGIPNKAIGFAAGQFGKLAEKMLVGRGVEVDFTWVDGETRLNTVIIQEDRGGQTTLTTSTLLVNPAHINELRESFFQVLESTSCLMLGGSLPEDVSPELYQEFINAAREWQIPVVFDGSGAGLRIGLEARPTVVKPNLDELQELTQREAKTFDATVTAARELQDRWRVSVVVTLGNLGAIAVLPERAYRIPPLQVEVRNAAGAGDGVLAGLTKSLAEGESLEHGLTLGFAIAGAILQTTATAEARPQDVEELISKIKLEPI